MRGIIQAIFFLSLMSLNAQSYQIDSTFGNNGKSIISSNYAPISVFYENNKYLFIYHNGATSVNYSGTIDTSFGNNGKIIFNSQNSNEFYFVKGAKLINGFVYVYGQRIINSNSNKDGFILKFSLSSNYDSSFGTNGKAVFDFGHNEEIINDIEIDSFNQIYAIGTRNNKLFLSRINLNGTIDNTFDTNGYKIYLTNQYEISVGVNLFLQSNEIILTGGSSFPINEPNYSKYLILLKVELNGNLINNFGENGIKKVLLSNSSCGIEVRKSFLKDNNELYFERLESCSFLIQINRLFKYNISENSLINLNSLPYNNVKFEIDSDNKIFITGNQRCDFTPCNRSYEIKKTHSDGTSDLNFNTTGNFTYRFGPVSDDESSTFYFHENGKILIAGYTTNNGNVGVPNTPGLGMIRITNSTLQTQDFDKRENKIFPNPTVKELNIVLNENQKIINIQIFDINGRIILSENDNIKKVNVESLKEGIYFIKIKTDKEENLLKFIKE